MTTWDVTAGPATSAPQPTIRPVALSASLIGAQHRRQQYQKDSPVVGAGTGNKTLLCSQFFNTNGMCSSGDACMYAHAFDELCHESQIMCIQGATQTTPGQQDAADHGPQLPIRCYFPHRLPDGTTLPGTYYDHLQLKRSCSKEEVNACYDHWRKSGYRSVRAVDPIKADVLDRVVVEARNVLSSDALRQQYDAILPPTPSVSSSSSNSNGNGTPPSGSTTPPRIPPSMAPVGGDHAGGMW